MQQSLEHRITRLERRNRLLLFSLISVVGLLMLTGATGSNGGDIVRCQRLEVIDNDGAVVAVLGIDSDGSRGLFVNDTAGRVRLAAIHDASQSALYALDSTGTIRVGVAQYAHGGGGVALHGENGRGGTVLYHKGDGSLKFYDVEGGVRYQVPPK